MNKNSRNLKILKDIVGIEQFKVIAERLNGEHIVFNNHSCQGFVSKEEREQAIRKDFFHGLSVWELAEKYGMAVSSIYKITEQVWNKQMS